MIEQWREECKNLSGSLTTNGPMPQQLIEKLLEENVSLKGKLSFEEVTFRKLGGLLDSVPGLDILAGLQKRTNADCLTLFRAIRYPTYKRMYDAVAQYGCSISNYEQERILEFYRNEDYGRKRKEIMSDQRFWTQPQERVVSGLPLFSLINDALQIHYSFRADTDMVAMAVVYIPYHLLESSKVKLIANAAIDLAYDNSERDFAVADFIRKEDHYQIDYAALRARGIDLHEIYSQGIPLTLKEAQALGIEQEFFLLDVYRIDDKKISALLDNAKLLKENAYFLHGFFGDQNVFARRRSKYLPNKCQRIRNA